VNVAGDKIHRHYPESRRRRTSPTPPGVSTATNVTDTTRSRLDLRNRNYSDTSEDSSRFVAGQRNVTTDARGGPGDGYVTDDSWYPAEVESP
jgi:hypothetical protein